jgi:putative toxin-antitoxin system antitoxin component (TIGR02293 family)
MSKQTASVQTARRPNQPTRLDEIVQREVNKAAEGAPTVASILDELASHGFTQSEILQLVVPGRTLARRRRAGGQLASEESDRAVRLARVAALAERVFGDGPKAQRWLRKPSPMLDSQAPIELLRTETGAQLVEQTLHRIDHGMFA